MHIDIDTIDDLKDELRTLQDSIFEYVDSRNELLKWCQEKADNAKQYTERIAFLDVIRKINE